MQPDLVSIGVPVRNGAIFLDEALNLLRNQTYTELEIIISDNVSDDGSTEIIRRHAAVDSRIRVYQQDTILTALDNFRFVFEQAHGDFFMWAACDDRRSLDYVEQLLTSLQAQPGAVLAFGEVAEFSDLSHWQSTPTFPYVFETLPHEKITARLRRYTRINCLHIYGLIRSNVLRSYSWFDIDNGPDIPLIIHLACLGDFIKVTGGCFYYYVPEKPKTLKERAIVNSLQRLKQFPELRLAWVCALAANKSGQFAGRPISKWRAFVVVYSNRHWRWIKPMLFGMAPAFVVAAYRRRLKCNHGNS